MDFEGLIEKLKQMYPGLIYYKGNNTHLFELPIDEEERKYFNIEFKNGACYLIVSGINESKFNLLTKSRYGILGKDEHYVKITSLDESEIKSAISKMATFCLLSYLKEKIDEPEFIEVNYVSKDAKSRKVLDEQDLCEVEQTIYLNPWNDKSKIAGNKVCSIFIDKCGENLSYNLIKCDKGISVVSQLNFDKVRNSKIFEGLMSFVGLYVNDEQKLIQSHPVFLNLSVYCVEDIMYYTIVASNIDLFE